jgi:hypothetical protein
MKKLSSIAIILLFIIDAFPQGNKLYQTGLTAEQNLNAIGNLTPYSTGGVGFDNRYEGTKGSPRLFDSLMASLLNIKGQNYYIQLRSNLDLISNSLIFINPKTDKLLSISSDIVNEVKINQEGKDMVFRTTKSKYFEKDIKDGEFFQVLKERHFYFIKLPVKKLIAADYKDAYSADRRYDEYITYYKYYIMSSDSIFHQIRLTDKSLIKIFPDKKDLINNAIKGNSYGSDEEMVLDILDKL